MPNSLRGARVAWTALLFTACARTLTIESRTLAPVAPASEDKTRLLNERVTDGHRVVLFGRAVQPDGSVFFSQREYTMDGTPIRSWQEGFWNARWNRFETRYTAGGAEQHINDDVNRSPEPARAFRDPTVLWFWRVLPRVNESVVVTYLAQNTITTSQIQYTYEGRDSTVVAGVRLRTHRVREDPVGAGGVFTIWWYDEAGMGVRRYHKTTHGEFIDELIARR